MLIVFVHLATLIWLWFYVTKFLRITFKFEVWISAKIYDVRYQTFNNQPLWKKLAHIVQ